MKPSTITKQIIALMQDLPDDWSVIKAEGGVLYLRHKSQIDVKLKGYHYVDVNLDGEDTQVILGYWNYRKIRKAAQTLVREKTMRAIERHDLLIPEDEIKIGGLGSLALLSSSALVRLPLEY
tara:strand:- start:128714 stop:129079 length:366 start_codon:yes stop_codon:yes gene_type:complete